MLSFGIRFGQGFDRVSLTKIMQTVPSEYDYDLIVIGCNPGGVACAREAASVGKKTVIIKCKQFTVAENEGFDENLKELADILQMEDEKHDATSIRVYSSSLRLKKNKGSKISSDMITSNVSRPSIKTRIDSPKNLSKQKKVRLSRLDLNNELFKRGQEGRKLMHTISILNDKVEDARNSGWRIPIILPPMTINWNKMTEQVMDYMMKENWKLVNSLSEEEVEVVDGFATFINSHTVKVFRFDDKNLEISADIICIALTSEYILPDDIIGAEDFGITCDDFIRMNGAPGRTLIVGATPEGLECAGITAYCQYPVTVVTRSKILSGHDNEISQMIVKDLKKKGVVFLENTTLKSIEAGPKNMLITKLTTLEATEEKDQKEILMEEEFQTVVFAVGKKTKVEFLNLNNSGVEVDMEAKKIKTNEYEMTSVPHIYAVGEITACRPENLQISELAGKLLGKRLFQNKTELMDYTMFPSVLYTPTEYAFIGISENTALYRLGQSCVSVYSGNFKPLEFFIQSKENMCFAKVIVYTPNDSVIGLHVYGPEAGEIIQGFSVALKNGLTMAQLKTVVGVNATKAQEVLKLRTPKKETLEVSA